MYVQNWSGCRMDEWYNEQKKCIAIVRKKTKKKIMSLKLVVTVLP